MGLLIFAMLVELVIKTIKEEVKIMTGSLAIDVGALLATIDVLMGNVVGETKVPIMASLSVVQVVTKFFLATIELLVIEIVGEIVGEVSVHE